MFRTTLEELEDAFLLGSDAKLEFGLDLDRRFRRCTC